MKSIRGGSGLGDSIYIRAVAEYLLRQGEQITVCSDQSAAFAYLDVKIEPFRREKIDVLAHYTQGKSNAATNQWQDVCASAKIPEIPLRFDWTVKNNILADDLCAQAAGRPIVVVHGGRAPMARVDGFGAELLPDRAAFDAATSALGDCFLVQIGKGHQIYPLKSDLNISGKTSIPDLFDVMSICAGVVAQCSFAVPLAECFDRPLLAIWAHRGLSTGRHQYVSSITPEKILSKATSSFVIDDLPACQIQQAAYAFRDSL